MYIQEIFVGMDLSPFAWHSTQRQVEFFCVFVLVYYLILQHPRGCVSPKLGRWQRLCVQIFVFVSRRGNCPGNAPFYSFICVHLSDLNLRNTTTYFQAKSGAWRGGIDMVE
jgi:hypothetical protein